MVASWTLAQLNELESAIATGATEVTYQGRTVKYASLDKLLRVRDEIRRSLGLTPLASASIMVAHNRGYPGPSTWGDDSIFSGF